MQLVRNDLPSTVLFPQTVKTKRGVCCCVYVVSLPSKSSKVENHSEKNYGVVFIPAAATLPNSAAAPDMCPLKSNLVRSFSEIPDNNKNRYALCLV